MDRMSELTCSAVGAGTIGLPLTTQSDFLLYRGYIGLTFNYFKEGCLLHVLLARIWAAAPDRLIGVVEGQCLLDDLGEC